MLLRKIVRAKEEEWGTPFRPLVWMALDLANILLGLSSKEDPLLCCSLQHPGFCCKPAKQLGLCLEGAVKWVELGGDAGQGDVWWDDQQGQSCQVPI